MYQPNIGKHDEMLHYPIPEIAMVTWQTNDGIKHTKEVAVARALPKNFSGELIFSIQANGEVTVTHEPFFQMPR